MPEVVDHKSWVNVSQSDTVIVFIHGLLSSPLACWTSKGGQYWPKMLMEDVAFANVSTYVAEYNTEISSGAYDIDQCAKSILDDLRIPVGSEKTPISYKNIIFVCHSLGGVIARRMLEQYREFFSEKNIGLVLIASPSLGSSYATALQSILKVYGHSVGLQLRENSESLVDLDNRFRNLIQNNPFLSFSGAEACENHGPLKFKYLPIRTRPIVEQNSASRYFGSAKIIFGTDHSSIVKPNSLSHPSHKFLKAYFYDNFFGKINIEDIKDNLDIKERGNIIKKEADPLFDLYHERHNAVYVERKSDAQLNTAMKTGSAWIYGPSGTGKTTLAKRWTSENRCAPIEITLSQITTDVNQDKLFDEVAQNLEANGYDIGKGGYLGCIDALVKICGSASVPLFIDEVPLNDPTAAEALPRAIASLLDGVKRKNSGEAKFIICSIIKPDNNKISGKLREQFAMLPQAIWSEDELDRLISTITSNLKISLSDKSKNDLLDASEGSPRFVKIFFRRMYGVESIKDEEVTVGIRETQQIIRGQI